MRSGAALEIELETAYNVYIVSNSLDVAVTQQEGPGRVAAVAAWIQSLPEERESKPILVGGGAVELYSGGAYTTSDLDFVGDLKIGAIRKLEAAGFRRRGRHWIHDDHELFIEFPGSALAEGETIASIRVGQYSVQLIGLEELIVDRLAAWLFWSSDIDGLNAYRLTQAGLEIDQQRLQQLAASNEVEDALRALEQLIESLGNSDPLPEQLERWARTALRETP